MRVVLIGAGNVATSLGLVLKQAGHEILALFSRTRQSASVLAEDLGVTYTTSLTELPHDADIYISLLKDDVLMQLAPIIVSLNTSALFVHTAGSLPLSLWGQAGAVRYGVMYPMQTFSKTKQVDWNTVPIFVEGSSIDVEQQLVDLSLSVSPDVRVLDTEGRRRLHIAAVFVCNFSNRMYAIGSRLLAESGVDFKVMLPLIEETAMKVRTISPEAAQTGPAIRGDVRVMNSHLDVLKSHPDLAEIYRLISDNIQKSIQND